MSRTKSRREPEAQPSEPTKKQSEELKALDFEQSCLVSAESAAIAKRDGA